jgi:cysteine desulfurase NifS
MMEYRKWEKGKLREDGRSGFDTPTGKFEIHSTVLEEYGYEPLPRYTEPVEGPLASPAIARAHPLVFNSGARPHTDFRSQHHGIDGLARDNPEPTVELHPDDAAARGIETGDLVRVRSPRGEVPLRARVTPDIVAGAVECSMGGGTPVGPRAWREWNVNELTDVQNYDEISGFPVYKALLCQVEKVEEATEATRRSAVRAPRAGATTPLPVKLPPPGRRVYLDNNATTPVSDAVREAMLPYLGERDGNPSSIHGGGRDAQTAVSKARRQVAALIGARPSRLVFTGGGSEADNLALKGVVLGARNGRRHVVTTRIEHPAILGAARFLEGQGEEVTWLEVDADGLVDPDHLRDALRDDTALVSVMLANNEVGTILPIQELAGITHERGALFHTDAVQAAGKIPLDVEALEVDLATISGHKFHGPKGIGALYVRKGVPLEPLVHGGKQESGLRGGTENVPGIVGMGRAAEDAVRTAQEGEAVQRRRDRLQAGILELVPEGQLNGHPERRLPNTLNLTLPELRGEALVVALDQHGVALSSGSACKAGSPEPTHVLLAMGRSAEEAHCSVRFSLSPETSDEDIDHTVAALGHVLEEMKTTVRFLPCK